MSCFEIPPVRLCLFVRLSWELARPALKGSSPFDDTFEAFREPRLPGKSLFSWKSLVWCPLNFLEPILVFLSPISDLVLCMPVYFISTKPNSIVPLLFMNDWAWVCPLFAYAWAFLALCMSDGFRCQELRDEGEPGSITILAMSSLFFMSCSGMWPSLFRFRGSSQSSS